MSTTRETTTEWELYIAYAALLISSLLPIIAGGHSSLKLSKASKQQRKRERLLQQQKGVDLGDEEEEDEDEDEEIERLTARDAYLFPIFGGITLTSLYLGFKYLDKTLINQILGGYFTLMSVLGLAKMLYEAMKVVISTKQMRTFHKYNLTLTRNKKPLENISFTHLTLFSLVLSTVFSSYHFYAPSWPLANFIALSFAYNAVSLLRLDSFWTGAALLSGLFFYDIFFVFFTPIMVSVAREFDAPIKIVWPKSSALPAAFTLLGLGDIVLPGIFLALALRFDHSLAQRRALESKQAVVSPSSSFARPYFFSCLFAYVSGLSTTMFVMHYFQAAQPALLYLSPACILSVIICAAVRGESQELWSFDDGADDGEKRTKGDSEDAVEKKQEERVLKTPLRRKSSRLSEGAKQEERAVETPLRRKSSRLSTPLKLD